MSIKAKSLIECGTHGKRVASVVCCHILQAQDKIVGFIENSDDPNDLQAWCEQCEMLYLKEKGLTEEFKKFHDMQVVCDLCYQCFKSRQAKL